jgi:glycosidase
MNKNWIKNAVIYHILIDRFAGFDSSKNALEPIFLGGNIKGIIEKLPHIESLGANVIWVSPFYKNEAYHGYHITDFYSVDKHFGAEKDIKKLIDETHRLGLKIICDFVPNHVSRKHPFFVDARNNPDSPYREWFVFEDWPQKYQTFLSVAELPKLNLDHKPTMDHVLGAARKWLGMGFDGLRLDHVVGLSNRNVSDLIEPLSKEFPNSVFIGEAWFNNAKFRELKTIRVPKKHLMWLLWRIGGRVDPMLYRNYKGLIDGVLDFKASDTLEAYANARTRRDRARLKSRLQRRPDSREPFRTVFLDNHDMERFLFRCGGDTGRLMEAAKLQFSLSQPVIIYYGTEVGMSQKHPFSFRKMHGDIYCRQPMPWEPGRQNASLLEFYKTLVRDKLSDKLPIK